MYDIVRVNPFRTLSRIPAVLQDVLVVLAKNITLKLATVASSHIIFR
jgi:hypothetical protein